MDDRLLAFTADQVSRLTGLSERQLWAWDKDGFFSPQYVEDVSADAERRRPYSRLYSFQDVVGLRTVGILRNEYRVPLQELKRFGAWLHQNYETPWASLRFYVVGKRVYFDDPETGTRVATNPPGQIAFPFNMERIAQAVRADVDRVRARPRDTVGRVTHSRNVVQNSAVVAGTRVPTDAIWSFHTAGYSPAAIIEEYPGLTPDDIRAAIAYEDQRHQQRAG